MLVAGPSPAKSVQVPFPAMVLTFPVVAETSRTMQAWLSTMNKSPAPFSVNDAIERNCASSAAPPSPEVPYPPVPANSEIDPVESTL